MAPSPTRPLALVCALSIAIAAPGAMASSSPRTVVHGIKFASVNIRYAPDGVKGALRAASSAASGFGFGFASPPPAAYGERPWSERGPRIADQVMWEAPDVVGFQEALWHQLQDLGEWLGEDYDWVGAGRSDGKRAGEAVPVFWRKDAVELVDVKHTWLSETPDVAGSVGWDAGLPRMVTSARLRLRAGTCAGAIDPGPPPEQPLEYFGPDLGPDLQFPVSAPSTAAGRCKPAASAPGLSDFWVLNTHWDDRGIVARTESAKIILRLADHIFASFAGSPAGQSGREPLVVLLGDLNSPAEEDGYRTLTDWRYSPEDRPRPGPDVTFRDARREVSLGTGKGRLSARYGDVHTFTGFQPTDTPAVIDVVMVTTKAGGGREPPCEVVRYGVLPNIFEGGFLISDHRMVSATLRCPLA